MANKIIKTFCIAKTVQDAISGSIFRQRMESNLKVFLIDWA